MGHLSIIKEEKMRNNNELDKLEYNELDEIEEQWCWNDCKEKVYVANGSPTVVNPGAITAKCGYTTTHTPKTTIWH